MVYIIPGEPQALARPRFSSRSRRVYNPMRHEMLILSITLQSQHNNQPLFEGPIHLDVIFFMPYPSKLTKAQRKDIEGSYHFTRCDLDNMVKFLADIGNGILYKDDAIISSISAKKVYSDNPRTEFSFQSLLQSKLESKNGIKKS